MKRKVLSLILAFLMIAPSVISCSEKTVGDENNPVQQGSDSAGETQTEAVEGYDINGYILDDLGDDLDFGGQRVSVLYWEDVENPEFWVEDFNGEPVNDAIHQRNIDVEDRLNIEYNWIPQMGNGNNIANYTNVARAGVMAGSGDYDIFAAYSRSIASCVSSGLTTNLENSEYIDFEKPWWPDSLVEESTIGDHIFFVSGDISTNILFMMYTVFYNKGLMEDFQLEAPTNHVFEGTWTISKLFEYTESIYRDLNGDGSKDIEDMFGFIMNGNYHCDAFITSSNIHYVDKDPDNMLKISDDIFGEKIVELLGLLGPWFESKDVMIKEQPGYSIPFGEERALFTLHHNQIAAKGLRDVDFAYGILPVPKYDEAQEDYRTCLGNPITLYSVSLDSKIGDISHAVLECAASEAYRLTSPAVFENNMKKKFSDQDIDAQMFDVIRNNVVFELGRFYNFELAAIIDTVSNAAVSNKGTWSSVSKKISSTLNSSMKRLVESFEEAIDKLD